MVLEQHIDVFRHFNRFFTRRLGLLNDTILRSSFTLAEVRVLWELAHHDTSSPGEISEALEMDPGYLTRLLQRFEQKGLISRRTDAEDRRRSLLQLTDEGRFAFAPLDQRQHEDVAALLAELPTDHQERLVRAMAEITKLLAPREAASSSPQITLRDPLPGDFGWIVERQGALYATEYGFDVRLEGDVAATVSRFVENFDSGSERCWIAEMNGVRCGSLMVIREDHQTARLRLLFVEPFARGFGLGRKLVRECLTFANAVGYRRIVLWTHTVLAAARTIYASEGFACVATETNLRWGDPITSETWERNLRNHGSRS